MKEALRYFSAWWNHYMKREVTISLNRIVPVWWITLIWLAIAFMIRGVYLVGMDAGKVFALTSAYKIVKGSGGAKD